MKPISENPNCSLFRRLKCRAWMLLSIPVMAFACHAGPEPLETVSSEGDCLSKEEAKAYLVGSGVLTSSFPVISHDVTDDFPAEGQYFLNPGNFTPDWGKCQWERYPEQEVLYVPIWPTYFHAAMDTSRQMRRNVPVVQRLKIVRDKASREMYLSYESVVPAESYYRRHRIHQGTGYINKQRKIFSATVIEQDTSGCVTNVLKYESGVLTDTLYAPYSRVNPYNSLRNYVWRTAQCVITRSGNENEELLCSLCGHPIDECTCEEPGITYCAHCLFPIDDCHCCLHCGRYPCVCDNGPDPGGGGGSSGHDHTGGGGDSSHIFPTASEIAQDPGVQAKMELAWELTLLNCTELGRREYGFLIYYDISTDTDCLGPIQKGAIVSNSQQSTIYMTGPYYIQEYSLCAAFHTHTSYQYVSSIMSRLTGPSNQDVNTANRSLMPGLVEDYSAHSLFSGDSKYNVHRLYVFGPDRCSTDYHYSL